MARTNLCIVLLVACAVTARAETTITPTEMLIRLTVQPKAAPKPALRYLLLPELREMQPGNPIPNYLKVAMEQASAEQETLSRSALRMADRAARMDKPDWQILHKAKTDGIGLLLPDVQKMRGLAAALQERFREESSQRRFDDCMVTAKTMFAISQHMSEHPTLIGGLVGIAIANIAIGQLDEMFEQPGCPNLYWALTNVPSPLVPLTRGIEGERMLIHGELHGIGGLKDTRVMTAAQIKKLVGYIDRLRETADSKSDKGARVYLDKRNKDEKVLSVARERLMEAGYSETLLRRFPADQVLLLDEKLAYEEIRDEAMKLIKIPAWQAEPLMEKVMPVKGSERMFDFLVPAFQKVRRAQTRLEQRIAMLRHVEAIRLYAAANGGKLPAKLTDCTVPLPDDPFTGKAFRYNVSGETAHLRGTPPPGEAKQAVYNVHYEITIKK